MKTEIEKSKQATREHKMRVSSLMYKVIRDLQTRAFNHDDSKLETPEIEGFAKHGPKLKNMTYSVDPTSEYQKCLKRDLKVALDHHYAHNDHHPEYFQMWQCYFCSRFFDNNEVLKRDDKAYCPVCGGGHLILEFELDKISAIQGMNLVQLLEMVCDWKAASERHSDGDIYSSIRKNADRFGYSYEMMNILLNTAKFLEDDKPTSGRIDV